MLRGLRAAAVCSAIAICLGAVAPVSAAGKPARRGCPKYKPVPPPGGTDAAKEVPNLPVTKVTDAATEETPVTIEFEQGLAAWWYAYDQGRGPIVGDDHYFNVQVETKKRSVGLHMLLEWPLVAEEIDMYVYNQYGAMEAWSEAFNQAPAEATGDTGGPGYEYINGLASYNCNGLTIESNAMWTTPQQATLKLWLGSADWSY